MEFKGLDQLRAHVPDLRSPSRSAIAALIVITVFTLTTAFFVAVDRAWPSWTLAGQVLILALAFVLASQFFRQKKRYLERHGDMAYRNAFARFVLTGLPVVFAAIAHIAYMPGPPIPPGWWTPGQVILGWLLVILGAALWARSVLTFGADNLAMLYVYFPHEGRMVESSIYRVLRHPVYAAIIRLAMGMALLNGNWFAVTFALFMPLGLTGWLTFVEEKELLERFGGSYAEYRQRVPAFWPRLRQIPAFFGFLLTGK